MMTKNKAIYEISSWLSSSCSEFHGELKPRIGDNDIYMCDCCYGELVDVLQALGVTLQEWMGICHEVIKETECKHNV
jgi:hypothetical protein